MDDNRKFKILNEFRPVSQARMKKGQPPYVIKQLQGSNRLNSSYVFNIDHTIEVQDGGYVYDMDNMTIIAPKAH